LKATADEFRKSVSQWLKPGTSRAGYGTTEQLAEKSTTRRKTVPQRLKPDRFG
jgi:hypothetical protein